MHIQSIICLVLLDLVYGIGQMITSDHTVRPPLFQDRISNSTNMFRPEPNQTHDVGIS